MKKFVLFIAVVFTLNAFAQDAGVINPVHLQINTSPDGAYTYKSYQSDPLKSRWYTLPNGLTVILSPNPTTPRIQTLIATKAGSKSDPADNTQVWLIILEHLLFKGTDKYGTLDFAQEHSLFNQIDALYEKLQSRKKRD
jgi:hypothetical protein